MSQKGDHMATRANATFTITGWDEAPYDDPPGGPKLVRVTVRKTFSGDVTGESTTELLMSKSEDGSAGYVAMERVVGRVGDRAGTFDVQHCAAMGGGSPRAYWFVVPGSGTGELRGLSGEVVYQHDASGARFTLDYDFQAGAAAT